VTHTALLEARNAPCAAQMLATHQALSAVQARPYWAESHFITVLRSPTARVWSFYQYVRRKQPQFQSQPLLYFLQRWRTFAPNTTASSGGAGSGSGSWPYSPHMHWQLSNWMTSQLASPPKASQTLTELMERQRQLSHPHSRAGVEALHLARQALLVQMDVVGITEDMAGFERVLAARWPETFGRQGLAMIAESSKTPRAPPAFGTSCTIPSGTEARNPTAKHQSRGNASLVLDEPTRAAIEELNLLDVALYRDAQAIAKLQTACSTTTSSATADGRSSGSPGSISTAARRRLWPKSAASTRKCFESARRKLVASLTDLAARGQAGNHHERI